MTWPKGISGNPSGRPKGQVSVTAQLKEMCHNHVGEDWEGELLKEKRRRNIPRARWLAAQLLLDCASEDDKARMSAMQEVINRVDGKPVQTHVIEDVTEPTPAQLLATLERELGLTHRPANPLAIISSDESTDDAS